MKYCPETTKIIIDNLKLGLNRMDSVELAYICYDTFTEWMKKPEFSSAVKMAEIECKKRNISIIQKAAITTWQAAAWWLERKCHEEFALRSKTELSGYIERGKTESEKRERLEKVKSFMDEILKEKADLIPARWGKKEKVIEGEIKEEKNNEQVVIK